MEPHLNLCASAPVALFEGWKPDDFGAFGSVVTAIATFLLLLVTGGAVFVARRQLREMRDTRRAQAQAYVMIDIRPSDHSMHILNFVIENLGSTTATDVSFAFTPKLDTGRSDYLLAESVLFRDGIPTLVPGRRIEFLFASAIELFNKPEVPRTYAVEVSFTDMWGERHTLPSTIDLSILEGIQFVTELGIHDAADALKTIAKVAKNVNSSGRIRVGVRDEDAHRLDDEVFEDLTGEHPHLGTRPLSPLTMALGRNVLVRTAVRKVRSSLAERRNGQTSD